MKSRVSSTIWLLALAINLVTGCGSDDPAATQIPTADPVYATLIYRLDDSINRNFDVGDALAWKGPFTFAAASGVITPQAGSTGPFPLLYDDGPQSVGGHEPDGESAGDGIWTVTVLVESPAQDWTFDYWPVSGTVDGMGGTILWVGCGGTLTVPAGETGALTVPGESFVPRTADAVAVSFSVDDTANRSYTAADSLVWKGSLAYDRVSRVLAYSSTWAGPFPLLHDDGPWTEGGHEPVGAFAGDHIWSVAAWVENSEELNFEYGAARHYTEATGGEWIWDGPRGTLTVEAGRTEPITATSLVVAEWGTIDLIIAIDLSANGANLAFEWRGVDWTTSPGIYGDFTDWSQVPLSQRQDFSTDIMTYTLSDHVGPHDGLLRSGDVLQWCLTLDSLDYRVGGASALEGVSLYLVDDGILQGGHAIEVQQSGGYYLTFTTP